jgi:hypothetical protein
MCEHLLQAEREHEEEQKHKGPDAIEAADGRIPLPGSR